MLVRNAWLLGLKPRGGGKRGSRQILLIKAYVLEGVLDEGRNNVMKNRAISLQARVGIDFDKPNVILFIYHEIQAKDFKVVRPPQWIKIEGRCMNGVSC